MVTDRQVKRLRRVLSLGLTLRRAADKANMDEKTARKYRQIGKLPSEVAVAHTWRTRQDSSHAGSLSGCPKGRASSISDACHSADKPC